MKRIHSQSDSELQRALLAFSPTAYAAMLCAEEGCQQIFRQGDRCPTCGSSALLNLADILRRPASKARQWKVIAKKYYRAAKGGVN